MDTFQQKLKTHFLEFRRRHIHTSLLHSGAPTAYDFEAVFDLTTAAVAAGAGDKDAV